MDWTKNLIKRQWVESLNKMKVVLSLQMLEPLLQINYLCFQVSNVTNLDNVSKITNKYNSLLFAEIPR